MFPHQEFAPQVVYRLRRAHEQIQTINDELGALVDSGSYKAEINFRPEEEGTYRLTVTAVVWRMPPFPLSVLISEIIHDMRSALDNLVCALHFEHSQSNCENTAFPMFAVDPAKPVQQPTSARRGRRSSRGNRTPADHFPMIEGIESDAQAIIRGLQPYLCTNGPEHDLLWALNKLSNIDKHQLFHVAAWAIPDAEFEVTPVRHVTKITHQKILHVRGPVKYGTPLAEAIVHSTHSQPEVNVKTDFGLDIAFDHASPVLPDATIGPTLREILAYVIGIVESFERLLPPSILVTQTNSSFVPAPELRI